jgi:hypothetical protein
MYGRLYLLRDLSLPDSSFARTSSEFRKSLVSKYMTGCLSNEIVLQFVMQNFLLFYVCVSVSNSKVEEGDYRGNLEEHQFNLCMFEVISLIFYHNRSSVICEKYICGLICCCRHKKGFRGSFQPCNILHLR